MIVETVEPHGLKWELSDPGSGNSIGPKMVSHLNDACARAEQRWKDEPDNVRYLIFFASESGRRHPIWIAGGNLQELAGLEQPAEGRAYAQSVCKIIDRINNLPCPVVVCIDGLAIGGGAEFSLIGDLRLATDRSRWIFKQMQMGLATGYGSCHRMIALFGLAKTQAVLLRGASLDPNQALNLGLVHQLSTDRKTMLRQANDWAQELVGLPRQSVEAQKSMLAVAASGQGADQELELFEQLWMGAAHREALAGRPG